MLNQSILEALFQADKQGTSIMERAAAKAECILLLEDQRCTATGDAPDLKRVFMDAEQIHALPPFCFGPLLIALFVFQDPHFVAQLSALNQPA